MSNLELVDRRLFLASTLAASARVAVTGPCANAAVAALEERQKLPVAAIVTEFRKNSHADVIVTKLLEGWDHDGGDGPALRLAGLYTDQVAKNDLSRELARKHGFPIFDSIEEAITLKTGRVQVAGVLSIGEHGDYPYTPDTSAFQFYI